LPGVRPEGLKGGVKYWDGQFDDARLAVALARTAAAQGALLLNYCPVTDLLHDAGKVSGVQCQDAETGIEYTVRAGCVVNATGVWVDEIRQRDGAASGVATQAMVAPSQGVHLVVDREFFPGDHALLIPKTDDGRVLFAVPWLGKVILGTTDTPRDDLSREPDASASEVDFILSEAAKVLQRAPTRADVKSIWVGLRPLVRPPDNEGVSTKKISREHTVLISPSGLVTVTGGKWTTYRAMAEDVLDKCVEASLLDRLPPSETNDFLLIGAPQKGAVRQRHNLVAAPGLEAYGTEADFVQQLEGHDSELAPGLTEAMIRFAARYEYARSIEDVLARRSRLLFLDAALAGKIAPRVAEILQSETGLDPRLDDFMALTVHYQNVP
jgi:glycerol-3-phosphate dehydrogenase